MYKVLIQDETGSCEITWYNQAYLKQKIKKGQKYRMYGKIKSKYGKREMVSPIIDEEGQSKNTGKIIPIYSLTYKLSQNVLRSIIDNAIREVKGKLDEKLPCYIREQYKLLDYNSAINKIHFPDTFLDYNTARRTLAFEELFAMQLALLQLKISYNNEEKRNCIFKRCKNV